MSWSFMEKVYLFQKMEESLVSTFIEIRLEVYGLYYSLFLEFVGASKNSKSFCMAGMVTSWERSTKKDGVGVPYVYFV